MESKNCTSKHICKGKIVTDVENQHDYQEEDVWGIELGDWDSHIYTTLYKMDNL